MTMCVCVFLPAFQRVEAESEDFSQTGQEAPQDECCGCGWPDHRCAARYGRLVELGYTTSGSRIWGICVVAFHRPSAQVQEFHNWFVTTGHLETAALVLRRDSSVDGSGSASFVCRFCAVRWGLQCLFQKGMEHARWDSGVSFPGKVSIWSQGPV